MSLVKTSARRETREIVRHTQRIADAAAAVDAHYGAGTSNSVGVHGKGNLSHLPSRFDSRKGHKLVDALEDAREGKRVMTKRLGMNERWFPKGEKARNLVPVARDNGQLKGHDFGHKGEGWGGPETLKVHKDNRARRLADMKMRRAGKMKSYEGLMSDRYGEHYDAVQAARKTMGLSSIGGHRPSNAFEPKKLKAFVRPTPGPIPLSRIPVLHDPHLLHVPRSAMNRVRSAVGAHPYLAAAALASAAGLGLGAIHATKKRRKSRS